MRPILERLALGEVADFEGLAAGVRVADLIADFSPEGEPWGQATLGREHRTARFLVRESVTGRRLRVWFDPEYRVLSVDFDYPGLTVRPAELVGRLGEPEAELAGEDELFPRLRERVYARRGLSLISDPDDRFLVRIVAFPATTADDYARQIRVNP
jgi:hypothetical protein